MIRALSFLAISAAAAGCAAAAGDADLYVVTRAGCGACERLKAAVEKDPTLVAGYDVTFIDAAKNPEAAERLRTRTVPTLIVMRDGREVARRTGYSSEEALRAWLDNRNRRRWRFR